MIRVAFSLLLLLPLIVHAQSVLERAEREVIVKWRSLASALDAASRLQPMAAQIEHVAAALPVDSYESGGLDRITVVRMTSSEGVPALVLALTGDPHVEYVEPRPIRQTCEIRAPGSRTANSLDGAPDDPYYNMQWGHQRIDIENAWNITTGDPDVIIAVVDLGVWFGHPDLAGQGWVNEAERNGVAGQDDDNNGYVDDTFGYDFIGMDGNPTPQPLEPIQSHGTHVAGVIAAIRNNGRGIAGIAPRCRIMNVRVGSHPSIPYGYEGIYYACRAGADVINCSWGGFSESAYENDIINYALNRGCVVVAAAGNSGTNDIHFPAGLPGVIAVAATGLADRAADFTQYGDWVQVSAPGVGIVSTIIGDNGTAAYASWQGTSMAAPYVAAVCGLALSRFPSLSGNALWTRTVAASDPIDLANPTRIGQLGTGRINAWRAVAADVAGLRLAGITFTEIGGNGDGRIRAGESAEIRVAIHNDLAPLSDVYGEISTTEDTIIVNTVPSFWGDVPLGGPFWGTPPFHITLPPESPRARIVPVTIDWFDANSRLLGRATHAVHLDSTFVSVSNGRLSLGFAENGSLGYYDYERDIYMGPGLRIEGRPSNALYHGSFVLAADGLVSDNAYGAYTSRLFDWEAVADSVARIVPSSRADIEARASFEDSRAGQMLFARVNAAVLGWTDPGADGFLILEYEVTNRSVNPWAAAWAGFFLDWDLGSAGANLSQLDTASGVAYVRQLAPGHPLAGVVPLHNDWDTYYVVQNRAEIDSSGWADPFKWQLLNSGVNQSPVFPMDLSHLVAVGPFGVGAHESVTVAFALVAGDDLNELRANAAAAGAHYTARQKLPPPAAQRTAGLYPNYVTQGSTLNLVLPESSQATVRFYNVLGRLVAEVSVPAVRTGAAKFNTAALNGASGLLLYRVESAAGNFSGKIFVVK